MYDIASIYSARSVDDAIRALQADPAAVVIAGGTDVLIKIREGKLAGCSLVSIHELGEELSGVTLADNGDVEIGPLTTFRGVTFSDVIRRTIPVLGEAADMAGGPQLRAAGTIGGTYCGNPLACAAALKTIELMERDDLAARSRQIGQIVTARCAQWQTKFPLLGDVRGLGAMIGLEFVKDPVTKAPNGDLVSALVQECARHGLLIENAGRWGQVVRFLAPLTITDRQLHCGLDILENALKTCTQ